MKIFTYFKLTDRSDNTPGGCRQQLEFISLLSKEWKVNFLTGH